VEKDFEGSLASSRTPVLLRIFPIFRKFLESLHEGQPRAE
jgi:hypothetical protein